jgi:hypothetical protein
MKTSKIVLLVLYVVFMLSIIVSIVLSLLKVRQPQAAASLTVFVWLFFIAFAVMGGVVAKGADRSVVGWVIGCFFLPIIMPLVLVLLKDKEVTASRVSSGEAATGTVDAGKQRKREELSSLREKGILTQAEYEKAMQKLDGGGST